MPYHVGSNQDCPPSKSYAVIKDADGEVMGCHESKEKANKQLAALNIAEKESASIDEWQDAMDDVVELSRDDT